MTTSLEIFNHQLVKQPVFFLGCLSLEELALPLNIRFPFCDTFIYIFSAENNDEKKNLQKCKQRIWKSLKTVPRPQH